MAKKSETTKKKEETKKTKEPKVEVVREKIIEKKKSSKMVIFLLLVIIAILGVYICYKEGLLDVKPEEKVVNKTENKEEKVEKEEPVEEIEVLEVVSNDVKHLYETLTTGLGEYCGVWNYFTEKKVTAADIPNNLATAIALNSLYKNGIAIDRTGTTFTSDQLNAKIKEIFGQNYNYENTNIDICPTYTYNEETHIYTTGNGICSGACPTPNKAKIVKAYKQNDKLEIYVRVLFSNLTEQVPNIYYKDFNKTQPIEVNKTSPVEYQIDDDTFKEGSLYKMTFTNEFGNYIFTSSEAVTN